MKSWKWRHHISPKLLRSCESKRHQNPEHHRQQMTRFSAQSARLFIAGDDFPGFLKTEELTTAKVSLCTYAEMVQCMYRTTPTDELLIMASKRHSLTRCSQRPTSEIVPGLERYCITCRYLGTSVQIQKQHRCQGKEMKTELWQLLLSSVIQQTR